MAFLSPNIDRRGRLIRFFIGVLFLVAALAVWFTLENFWITLILAISAAIPLFEAARGWCALRACKIKTPF